MTAGDIAGIIMASAFGIFLVCFGIAFLVDIWRNG